MKTKKILLGISTIVIIVIIGMVIIMLNNKTKTNTTGETTEKTTKTEYLVDKVEIGDYVDIGINYENQQSFESNDYVTATNTLTGWRVLSKTGSGETGTIQLVSAGCPLTYYYSDLKANTAIQELDSLYKELTILSYDAIGIGFTANGFESNNLQTIFTANEYIDTTTEVHALRTEEVEKVYTTITGKTKPMADLYGKYVLGTTTLKAETVSNWKENYTDLLANGQDYWLAGETQEDSRVWRIAYNGGAFGGAMATYGVRPVISLQSGVKLNSNNVGDGSTSTSAYTITK